MGRDSLRSQTGPVQVLPHERLGSGSPRRRNAARLRDFPRFARRAKRQCRKIVDVCGRRFGEFRRRRCQCFFDQTRIALEQPQRLIFFRHRAHKQVIEAAHQICQHRARQAERPRP
jgi:hypothetical protein